MAKENGGPITPPVTSNPVSALQTVGLVNAVGGMTPEIQAELLKLLQQQTAVTELDYEVKMRAKAEYERQKQQQLEDTLIIAENAKAEEQRRRANERTCNHAKPNNHPNTICMTAPGVRWYMCLGCQKIWETKGGDLGRAYDLEGVPLPSHLIPNEDRTGGF